MVVNVMISWLVAMIPYSGVLHDLLIMNLAKIFFLFILEYIPSNISSSNWLYLFYDYFGILILLA